MEDQGRRLSRDQSCGIRGALRRTSSCTHTKEQSRMYTHCGLCSQCVDRRLNALAADFTNDEDPKEMYAADVVTGPREEADLTMIERYFGTCVEIDRLAIGNESEQNKAVSDFLAKFPETARVLRFLGKPAQEGAKDIFAMLRRHARDVCKTFETIVSEQSALVIRKDYPVNCLLGIAVGRSKSVERHGCSESDDSGEGGSGQQLGRWQADHR